MKHTPSRAIALGIPFFAAFIGLSSACSVTTSEPEPAQRVADTAQGHNANPRAHLAGQAVAIDPETGEIVEPSAANIQSMSAQGQGGNVAPVAFRLANGATVATLGSHRFSASTIRLNSDGSITKGCTDLHTAEVHNHD